MAVLEWPLTSPPGYVRHIVPLATSARHSAWCISWGETQRQSIYSDPGYLDGYYTSQPSSGLAAARMTALLTYRSRDSFESRFGRKAQVQKQDEELITPPESPKSHAKDAYAAHNDGHRNTKSRTPKSRPSTSASVSSASAPQPTSSPKPNIFSAQSYLRYQGDKFISRFDANCYIHLTRKLDTHDISRDRRLPDELDSEALERTISLLPPRALVISIATDGLFTPSEQRELAAHIPGAELVVIPSPDGHDGFLLEFEHINTHILAFLRRELPELYEVNGEEEEAPLEGFEVTKTSLFGEAEADITQW